MMMETLDIRQKLHQYENNDVEYMFTTEDIKLFDERRARRLTGESNTYNWQEAKDIITGKKLI
jgi:hypothetical protein